MSELHVIFEVGDAEYAVAACDVLVMESFERATRVPGTVAWVAGVIQVRGEVVPVVDLRRRFGLEPVERTLDHRVIVVMIGTRRVGLLAERARSVVPIESAQVRPPPDVVASRSHRFVRGVAHVDDRIIMIVDTERIASAEGQTGGRQRAES